tara:strand:+ start:1971 stop:2270 length:300 start_codon:yes stop_codon:yes gene_type:complete
MARREDRDFVRDYSTIIDCTGLEQDTDPTDHPAVRRKASKDEPKQGKARKIIRQFDSFDEADAWRKKHHPKDKHVEGGKRRCQIRRMGQDGTKFGVRLT